MGQLRGKQRQGFTLVELVISVCVMAIISVYMLQFFIGAKDLTRRAEDLDASVFLATDMMESIKAEVWDSSPVLKAFGSPIVDETDAIYQWNSYYDQDWSPLAEATSQAVYASQLTLVPLSDPGEAKILYEVKAEIRRLKPYFRGKELQPILYTLQSKLYIGDLKEVVNR